MSRFDFYSRFCRRTTNGSARPSTGVKSKMKNAATALLHSLQSLRRWLPIIIAVTFPGEITLTRRKIGFAEALDLIVATDNRYSREAYVFFRDSLDNTTKQQKKTMGAPARRQRRRFGLIAVE